MASRHRVPIALTIAGSDSGAGAGLQADLKTFAAIGVHGVSAVTCLTAQNPRRVTRIWPVPAAMLRAQLEALFEELPPSAAKTGMLYSAGLIQVVIDWWEAGSRPPLVVDPVMVATSGARLLRPGAIRLLEQRLLPLATLVTPNLDEANLLLSATLKSNDDLRGAARELHRRYGCPVLVKGGHLRQRTAVDVLFDGRRELMLSAPFVQGITTHGTGCTYSAAIAAYLALGQPLPVAVRRAKSLVTAAIRGSVRVGRHTTLDPFQGV